jgi:hypothetical protein
MDKTIQMEKHLIEGWGLWWAGWQKQTKERLRKHKMSPRAFVDTHLVDSSGSVSSETKGLSRNPA